MWRQCQLPQDPALRWLAAGQQQQVADCLEHSSISEGSRELDFAFGNLGDANPLDKRDALIIQARFQDFDKFGVIAAHDGGGFNHGHAAAETGMCLGHLDAVGPPPMISDDPVFPIGKNCLVMRNGPVQPRNRRHHGDEPVAMTI